MILRIILYTAYSRKICRISFCVKSF